jgi:predicted subunit of tRNA(5-methylaminomethyl-2-thiouridylate) methyltransferase
MFSGGRDSTLAALRLAERRENLVLVTISSGHLHGIEAVKRRLQELSSQLPPETQWLRIRQPLELATDTSFYAQTCLPCHHAYVVVAAAIAGELGARRLAFGYTTYQDDWPEQTPLAIVRLRSVLDRHGIELVLPVHDLRSKREAIAELDRRGVSSGALEQKCSMQVNNVRLSPDHLDQQTQLWQDAIAASLTRLDGLALSILDSRSLNEMAMEIAA